MKRLQEAQKIVKGILRVAETDGLYEQAAEVLTGIQHLQEWMEGILRAAGEDR